MKSKADENALFLRSLWHQGTQFTCFTSTKVQILTQEFFFLHLGLPVMSYACCSIYMVISQAYVLRHRDSQGINYSTLLLMYQNMCGQFNRTKPVERNAPTKPLCNLANRALFILCLLSTELNLSISAN
jgi:hypothetical protein